MVFMETSRSVANDSESHAYYLSKGNTIWAKFIFDLSFNEIGKVYEQLDSSARGQLVQGLCTTRRKLLLLETDSTTTICLIPDKMSEVASGTDGACWDSRSGWGSRSSPFSFCAPKDLRHLHRSIGCGFESLQISRTLSSSQWAWYLRRNALEMQPFHRVTRHFS
jgi:hypothetical protein